MAHWAEDVHAAPSVRELDARLWAFAAARAVARARIEERMFGI